MIDFLDSPIKVVHNLEDGCSFSKHHTEWRWWCLPEMIWRFKLNMEAPLTIELENGIQIKPNYNFDTNLGSIPIPLRPFYPKDEFPICYALHDDEYNRHGIYVKFVGKSFFEFYPTNRLGADRRLKHNILKIGEGSKVRADSIYTAVRFGGWGPWALGSVKEDSNAKV